MNEVYIRVNKKKLNEIILKLIIKYCYYLKSIAFNFEQISQQLIEEFGLKFEQKLSQISFKTTSNSVDKHNKLLRLCPNINGFVDGHITDLSVFVGNDSVLVPKLSKIGLRPESQDFDYIENFAKTYGNSLKSVLFEACLGVDDIETNVLMKKIVYLKSFQKLDLMLEFSAHSTQEFIENFKTSIVTGVIMRSNPTIIVEIERKNENS